MADPSTAGYGPDEALADVTASRESVADRLVTPWWYHPILGALLAAIVLVSALDAATWIVLVVTVSCAVGMGILAGAYQRVTGLWVDLRNTGPRSRRWWLAYAAVVLITIGLAIAPSFTDVAYPVPVAVLIATVVLAATIILGRRIDTALREEIRSGSASLPTAA